MTTRTTIWYPTMDLRFHTEDGLKILQQRWIEHKSLLVAEGPTMIAREEDHPTGAFEWRDVPLIEEKTDDLAG